jgi:hypothetical protein
MAQTSILTFLVCVWLLIQIYLTLVLTSILPGLAGTFIGSFACTLHWFSLPHLILLLVTLVTIVIQAKHRTNDSIFFPVICLICLLPTWFLATGMWAGGDDGPGLAWFFFLGGASLLNIVIAIPTLFIANRNYLLNKSKT